ncbi:MAG: hypothetical protein ABH834_00450 [Candidatus Altiarchaeota archaeon]
MLGKSIIPLVLAVVLLCGCLGGEEKAPEKTTTVIIENISPAQTTMKMQNDTEWTTTTKRLVAATTLPRVVIPAEHGEIIVPELAETKTFKLDNESRICMRGTRIIVRMYSNTTCEECIWVRDIYDKVVKEWTDRGKVHPMRWELDIQDDAMTLDKEDEVPALEVKYHRRYSPEKVVPTFLIGCKYYREGAGYYETQDTAAEERELNKVINDLIFYRDRKELADAYYNAGPPNVISDYTTSTLFTSTTSTTSTSSTSTTSTITITTSSTSTTSTTLIIPNWHLTPYVPDLPPPIIGTPIPQ